MNIRILILLYILISLKTFGQEENRWIYYSTTENDNALCYYDIETIQYNPNNTIAVWIKFDYLTPKYSINSKKYIDETLSRVILDCGERSIGNLDIIIYYTDGTNYSDMKGYSDDVSVIIPESVGEDLYFRLCK